MRWKEKALSVLGSPTPDTAGAEVVTVWDKQQFKNEDL